MSAAVRGAASRRASRANERDRIIGSESGGNEEKLSLSLGPLHGVVVLDFRDWGKDRGLTGLGQPGFHRLTILDGIEGAHAFEIRDEGLHEPLHFVGMLFGNLVGFRGVGLQVVELIVGFPPVERRKIVVGQLPLAESIAGEVLVAARVREV